METLAYSEAFYIFASISLIIVAILAIILIGVGIFIFVKVKNIIKTVDEQATKISQDIDATREQVLEKTERFGGILQTLIGTFIVKKAVTKKRKKSTKK